MKTVYIAFAKSKDDTKAQADMYLFMKKGVMLYDQGVAGRLALHLTYWSIAQKNNRETEPSGLGWELFENYLIAKEKFKPDYFLYENNKSAAQTIKDEIKKRFNVWDGMFLNPDSGARYIEINSALVSAQNRQRFYVHNCGDVGQPEDRGILLKDILESGQGWTEKSYAVTTRDSGAIPEDTLKRKRHTMVAEPVIFQIPHGYNNGGCKYGKSPTLTANGYWQDNNKVVEPVCLQEQVYGRKACADGSYDRRYEVRDDGKSGSLTGTNRQNAIAEPVRIGTYPSTAKNTQSKQYRIYDIDGKSTMLCGEGGGLGAKTGLYAIPKYLNDKNMEHLMRPFGAKGKIVSEDTDKSPTVLAAAGAGGGNAIYYAERTDGKTYPVYEVRDGMITIKGKQYPIKLKDGYYIIRKLTVTECCRLQGMPDWWFLDKEGNKILSDTQAYKGLGNGWQLDTVKYILEHGLRNIPRNEELVVLSLYDGIATGRRILEELGFTNVKYYAYEIDKHCVKLTSYRYPDIIHCGDAFKVRNKGEIEKII